MNDVIQSNSAAQLKSVIERAERLLEDKAAVMADLKEVFAEAKGNGFDVKIIRAVIKRRAADAAKLQEEDALFQIYWGAVNGELFPE